MLAEGRAYSCRFVRLSVHLFVRLSLFCLEHISKRIEGNLNKLHTLLEGHEENCIARTNPEASIYGVTSTFQCLQ